MAVTSARNIVNMKEKVHFSHGEARIDKYTLADELPAKLKELRLRPLAMPALHTGYTVKKLTTDDKEQMLQFLRRFFFRDEPMNLAVKLLETPDSRCIELEDYAALTLEDEVSFAAVDDNGEFVGVIVNGISRREATDKSDEECPNPKFRRILSVLSHLDHEARIWEKLPSKCETVLEVRIASTHTDWRGRGLMRVLCEESERMARELGAGALRMDATSAFSAAAAERLSYRCVYAVKYSSLPAAPAPAPPHVEARVYLKEI